MSAFLSWGLTRSAGSDGPAGPSGPPLVIARGACWSKAKKTVLLPLLLACCSCWRAGFCLGLCARCALPFHACLLRRRKRRPGPLAAPHPCAPLPSPPLRGQTIRLLGANLPCSPSGRCRGKHRVPGPLKTDSNLPAFFGPLTPTQDKQTQKTHQLFFFPPPLFPFFFVLSSFPFRLFFFSFPFFFSGGVWPGCFPDGENRPSLLGSRSFGFPVDPRTCSRAGLVRDRAAPALGGTWRAGKMDLVAAGPGWVGLPAWRSRHEHDGAAWLLAAGYNPLGSILCRWPAPSRWNRRREKNRRPLPLPPTRAESKAAWFSSSHASTDGPSDKPDVE